MILSVLLTKFTWFPTWVASPLCIAGWLYIGYTIWRYECWRASGPRGIYLNPGGMNGDIRVVLAWLFFGPALMGVNVALRRGWIHRNREGKLTFEKEEKEVEIQVDLE